MKRLILGAIAALAAGEVAAAPFCVITAYAQQCWYFDYPSCQRAAAQSRGACVAQDEGRSEERRPTFQPPQRASGAPFCVVAGFGANCWYYDAPSCQQAAQQARGACVVNQDR